MRIKDYPEGSLVDTSRMLFDNEDTGTHSVDMATLKEQFGGSGGDIFDLLDEIPGDALRKTIWRGKNLGTYLTDEQNASLLDKTFKGLFLGDYWVGSSGTKYVIVDFNYWNTELELDYGDVLSPFDVYNNHVVIMPCCVERTKLTMYDDAHPKTGGYKNSLVKAWLNDNSWSNEMKTVFRDNTEYGVMARLRFFNDSINSVDDSGKLLSYVSDATWAEIPSQAMIFGHEIVKMSPDYSANPNNFPKSNNVQLSAFRIRPNEMFNYTHKSEPNELYQTKTLSNYKIWLKDFVSLDIGLTLDSDLVQSVSSVNYDDNPEKGIMPIFGIQGRNSEDLDPV